MILAMTIVLLIVLNILVFKTRMGMAMRATAQDKTMSALVVSLRSHEPDESVELTYRRGGETFSTTIDLGAR